MRSLGEGRIASGFRPARSQKCPIRLFSGCNRASPRLVKKAVKMASNPEDDVSTMSVTIHQENHSFRRPIGIDDYVMPPAPSIWLFSQTRGPRS